ncbi:hypothetical protein BGZ63DRAFT_454713 [Mariannaea sp. PMI_226]|nr:hypothetical protein BGZ63DRAFT_454713 [Mariannaea sp. PMI_226]
MAPSPKIYSTFSVSSGSLCFGSLHNIWHGASVPVQGFPNVRPQPSGTVNAHQIEYNISAQNGKFNAFHLVDTQTGEVTAWFLAHATVDPEKELDKILRVSGSPYEEDSGSSMNDDKTAAEGIFVINRYDWTYYDKRSWDEIGEGVEEGENDFLANSNSLGIVDLAEAKTKVLQWKEQRPSQRDWSEGGVWLYIPHGEYMFGRFGFDDEHTAARSFLFFSASTDFRRTSFAGLQQTLRKLETPEERFERRLGEGFDFSGLETIHNMSRQPDDPNILALSPPPPPEADRLGPYKRSQYVLREQDIDTLRSYPRVSQMGNFIDPWKQPLFDLINEMIMSYLERTILPRVSNQTVAAAAEDIFPHHRETGQPKHIDVFFFNHFTQPHADPIPEFDVAYVGSRILAFLVSRSEDSSVVFEKECIAGICRVVAFILTEIFELANGHSQDDRRTKIMPCDIRLAVFFDPQLRELLQFSRVYWEGGKDLS